MGFVIRGLDADQFSHLFGLSDQELEKMGARRQVCNEHPGYPDRIEMREAEIGESILLVNHMSMEKNTPYRASHAIYVLEHAKKSYEAANTIPPVMYDRMLSLRAFDKDGMMIDAVVAKGDEIQVAIERLFENAAVDHIDAHNAARGCFSGRVTRG